jgi:hypothetical protein
VAHLLILRGAVGAGKSSVANLIQALRDPVRVVEVDEVKLRNHGTTAESSREDFFEAGREARSYLDQGFDTVVVEAFCDKLHIDWVLNQVGRELDSPDVTLLWLDCTLQTSLRRKVPALSRETIIGQHRRYPYRYVLPGGGDHVITTDEIPLEDVVNEILSLLPPEGVGISS